MRSKMMASSLTKAMFRSRCGADHRGVQLGHLLQRVGVVAGHHLLDAREGVLAVAGIDALGRVADVEILLPAHAGGLL
jgi:hypothetical protein